MADSMTTEAAADDVKRKLAQMVGEYARLLSLLDMTGRIAKMMRFYAFEETGEFWSGENENFGGELLADEASGEGRLEERLREDRQSAGFEPLNLALTAEGRDTAAVKMTHGDDNGFTQPVWPRAAQEERLGTGKSVVTGRYSDTAQQICERALEGYAFGERANIRPFSGMRQILQPTKRNMEKAFMRIMAFGSRTGNMPINCARTKRQALCCALSRR